ncbi:MAG TPA: thioredoxin-disulfide reductase [Candidatus Anaerotruncus excrementipullorum]|uniref:Thioredoxin reductase n=1 Tax=Candidatus Anaerotruncus excrementipullorum TaxID=2838465 RepID=A0A9D2B6N4_9FIRM|nr:thioredoxin-disulfide reductase [Candidatus Anaerotruncus excrementipullorum]
MEQYDILIIGAGPAGMTAAIYGQRAGYRTLILEEAVLGGQIANTPEVENYPAVGKISGVELGMNLYNQVLEQGAQVEFDGVVSAQLAGPLKTLTTQSGKVYTARAVIIANGAKRRKLGIPGEEAYAGRGVSYCATCDGGFFKGKSTVVVGGGNTALEDALYLANLCTQVHLIHRRDTFRGGKVLVDAVLARENIQVHYDTVPVEVVSADGQKVSGLTVRNVKTGAQELLEAQGVFVAVGLAPDNQLFAGQIELDPAGYIAAGEDCKTNLEGVFAAGDTRTKTVRQIVTAAGDGAVAAAEAGNYLMRQ